MATADGGGYEGGLTGGKFRKRPFRKAASATPYDRPPALDHRALRNRNGQGERNRWLSKIVDPASRLINYGASMFFASVFRKRLAPAPPPPAQTATADVSASIEETAQVTDVNLNEHVPDEIPANTTPEVMQLGVIGVKNTQGNFDVAISDLELLLQQKTFTRGEFDRLTDLLRSRTIDLAEENESKKTELNKLQVASHVDKQERTAGLQVNGAEISKLFGVISRPGASISVTEEEVASPMELAKSFMGSRSSQLALPTSTLPCPSLREIATVQSSQQISPHSSNSLVTPRSTVRFSGLGENGYRTPRTYGRSALYKMSRSPYFKSQSVKSLQGTQPGEGNELPPSHQISSVALSGGKQVLKRRSSFVEDDSGSLGPIRRTRQKSNMGSPLKENLPSTGRFLSTSATSALQGSTASALKPLLSNGLQKNISYKEDGVSGAKKYSVPEQSSLMARKILQQLDQLVPSPKGKSLEANTITNVESPFKLTLNMLNGKALKSVKDIDYSKMNAEANEKFGGGTDLFKTCYAASTSQMQVIAENNEPLKLPFSEGKPLPETCGLDDVTVSVGNNKPGTTSGKKAGAEANKPAISSPVATIQKKPSFQIQAPESSWDLEMDNYVCGIDSDLKFSEKEKSKPPMLETNRFIAETTPQEKPSLSFGKRLDSSSTSIRGAENFPGGTYAIEKVNEESAPQKTQAFAESSSQEEHVFGLSALKGRSSIPLAPAEEKNIEPSFSFRSKSAPTVIFSSTISSFNNPTGLKFGLNSEPKLGKLASISNGSSTMETNQTGTLDHSQGKKTKIVQESSMPAAPLSFAFRATSPINAPQLVSESASVLAIPSVPSFKDESVRKEFSSVSVSSTVTKCDDENLESKDYKGSPFGLISSMAHETAPTPSSSGSGVFGFSFTGPSGASFNSGHSGSGTSFFTGSDFGSKVASKQFSFDSNLGSGQSSSISFGANASNSTSQSTASPIFGTGSASSFQSVTAEAATPTFGVSAFNSQSAATSTFGVSTPSSQLTATPIFGVSASNSQPAAAISASSSHSTATPKFGVSASSSQSAATPIFGVSVSSSQSDATPTFGASASSSHSAATPTFGLSAFSSQSAAKPTFGVSASSSQCTAAPTFGVSASSSQSSATPTFGVSASSSHSFAIPTFGVSASNSQFAAPLIFGSGFASSSQSATTPVFGSGFSLSPSAAQLSFGQPSASLTDTPTFGSASSAPAFSFSSIATGTKTTSLPISPFGFGMPAQPVTFSSSMPGNTQMNEDNMTEDTVQAAMPIVPSFGQTVPSTPPLVNFGSPVPQQGFQFSSQPSSAFPQAPQFQGAGGSFSLGSGGGGDKSNRRIIKPIRNRLRKK